MAIQLDGLTRDGVGAAALNIPNYWSAPQTFGAGIIVPENLAIVGDVRRAWTVSIQKTGGEILAFSRSGLLVASGRAGTGPDDPGDDPAVWQAAADWDGAGAGVIQVNAGQYYAYVQLPSNRTLRGEGVGTVLTLPNGANRDVVTNKDWAAGNSDIYIERIFLHGNRLNQQVVNGDGPGQSLISLVNVDTFRVDGVIGQSAVLHGVDCATRNIATNSFNDPGSRYGTIVHCEFWDCGDDGITTHWSSHIDITLNFLHDMAASYSGSSNGVEIDDGSEHITVTKNKLTRNKKGFQAQGHAGRRAARHVLFADNDSWGNELHGGFIDVPDPGATGTYGHSIQVVDNRIWGNVGNGNAKGLSIQNTRSVLVANNLIKGNGAYGLLFIDYVDGALVTGNIIEDNGVYGITTNGSTTISDSLFVDNIVRDTRTPKIQQYGFNRSTSDTFSGVTFKNNKLGGNLLGAFDWTPATRPAGLILQGNEGYDDAQGLSTEDKPANAPDGTLWVERDTGLLYVKNGANWKRNYFHDPTTMRWGFNRNSASDTIDLDGGIIARKPADSFSVPFLARNSDPGATANAAVRFEAQLSDTGGAGGIRAGSMHVGKANEWQSGTSSTFNAFIDWYVAKAGAYAARARLDADGVFDAYGGFKVNGVPFLEADGDLLLSLTPASDNAVDAGRADRNFRNLYVKLAEKSVLFTGASGHVEEDAAFFSYDKALRRLALNRATASGSLHVGGTSYFQNDTNGFGVAIVGRNSDNTAGAAQAVRFEGQLSFTGGSGGTRAAGWEAGKRNDWQNNISSTYNAYMDFFVTEAGAYAARARLTAAGFDAYGGLLVNGTRLFEADGDFGTHFILASDNAFDIGRGDRRLRDIYLAGTLRSDATTGIKVGGAATEKLGFFGATPIVRPAGIADPSGGSVIDSQARTAVAAIITALEQLGLLTPA